MRFLRDKAPIGWYLPLILACPLPFWLLFGWTVYAEEIGYYADMRRVMVLGLGFAALGIGLATWEICDSAPRQRHSSMRRALGILELLACLACLGYLHQRHLFHHGPHG